MPSITELPMSEQRLPAHQRAMMADPAYPDQIDDSDVLSLLVGPVSALREQAQWLITCLARNRQIDRDLWEDLARLAGGVLDDTDGVLCLSCLRAGRVELGRGRGFDEKKCDACLRLEREL